MADYAFITHGTVPWVNHNSGTMTPSRLRSLSPMPAKKEITRSISVPQLAKTSLVSSPPPESEGMNTIPDPRATTPQPAAISRQNSNESQQLDLGQEVAMLSTKLINAINHSTMLDDSLQQTRHDLEAAREQLARLEAQVIEHEHKVSQGLLVEKVVFDKMEKQYAVELQEEKNRRAAADAAKRKTDSEVEALTAALFEEANVMVAAARKETEASEKRSEHFKQQIADAEVLQHSLQEQLQDLKGVMEKMSIQGDDNESNTLATTPAPSTPGITPADKMFKMLEAVNLTPHTPNTPGIQEISPDHPLYFSHLISPVLRSDLTAYKEFQEMLKTTARSSAPASRVSSGNYGSLNVLGLGSLTNVSTSSLPGAIKSPTSAGNSSPRESIVGAVMPNLKDEKFYKRALVEDIEPTLRLDIAPGLSWMARRTVLNSITAGSLVVEPNPPVTSRFRPPIFPCSLCGEMRKGDEYARKYRFKPADTEESQRYPLCDWCLGRVRATCDYIGFLRMVAAGHWRAETDEEKKSTWEESVRLRERMFWTRVGGGVVPSFLPRREGDSSPALPVEPATLRASQDSEARFEPVDISVVDAHADHSTQKSEDDPFHTDSNGINNKRASIGKATITSTTNIADDVTTRPTEPSPTPSFTSHYSEETSLANQASAQLHSESQAASLPSSPSLPQHQTQEKALPLPPPRLQRQRSGTFPSAPPLPARKKREERLSVQIPGSFD